MADLSEIIVTNVLGLLALIYSWSMVFKDYIIAIVVGYVGWSYDRGRRYNYLADRWYILMNMNVPDFFDSEKTKEYEKCYNEKTGRKYRQYARMCWGFVEDVISNNYFWEGSLGAKNYIIVYDDTIKDFIHLHHAWLRNNTVLFSLPKFRKVLKERFGNEICKEDQELYEWISKK